jgi:hypothetical protein
MSTSQIPVAKKVEPVAYRKDAPEMGCLLGGIFGLVIVLFGFSLLGVAFIVLAAVARDMGFRDVVAAFLVSAMLFALMLLIDTYAHVREIYRRMR